MISLDRANVVVGGVLQPLGKLLEGSKGITFDSRKSVQVNMEKSSTTAKA